MARFHPYDAETGPAASPVRLARQIAEGLFAPADVAYADVQSTRDNRFQTRITHT